MRYFLNLIVIPLVPVVFLSGAAGMLTGGVSVAAGMFLAGASAGVSKVFPDPAGAEQRCCPGSRAIIGTAGIVADRAVLCAGGDSGVGRKTQESRELRKM